MQTSTCHHTKQSASIFAKISYTGRSAASKMTQSSELRSQHTLDWESKRSVHFLWTINRSVSGCLTCKRSNGCQRISLLMWHSQSLAMCSATGWKPKSRLGIRRSSSIATTTLKWTLKWLLHFISQPQWAVSTDSSAFVWYVSFIFVVAQKGIGANLLKVGTKRRRTVA